MEMAGIRKETEKGQEKWEGQGGGGGTGTRAGQDLLLHSFNHVF